MQKNRPYAELFDRAFLTLIDKAPSERTLAAAERAHEEVEVYMSGRMTAAAGTAKYVRMPGHQVRKLEIGFSKPILAILDDEQKYDVVSHEFAHIVDAILKGKSDHGLQWRALHVMMGGSGQTRHNYDLTGIKPPLTRMVVRAIGGDREFRVTRQRWAKLAPTGAYALVAEEDWQGRKMVARREVTPAANAPAPAPAARVQDWHGAVDRGKTKWDFHPGQRVTVTCSRRGTFTGVVKKLLVKNVRVKSDRDGETYRCPPSLLTALAGV
jgi:hypothetical protein